MEEVPNKNKSIILHETGGGNDKKLTEIKSKSDINVPVTLMKESSNISAPKKLWPIKLLPKPHIKSNPDIKSLQKTLAPVYKLTHSNKLLSIKLNIPDKVIPIPSVSADEIETTTPTSSLTAVPALTLINPAKTINATNISTVTTATTSLTTTTLTNQNNQSNKSFPLTPVSIKNLPPEVKQILLSKKSKLLPIDLPNTNYKVVANPSTSALLYQKQQQHKQQLQKIKFTTLPRLVPFHTTTTTLAITTNSLPLISSSTEPKLLIASHQQLKQGSSPLIAENKDGQPEQQQLRYKENDDQKKKTTAIISNPVGRINIQISNGILSDPDGPIKIMSICKDKLKNKDSESEKKEYEQIPELQHDSNKVLIKKLAKKPEQQKSTIKMKTNNKIMLSPRMVARSKSFQMGVKLKKNDIDKKNTQIHQRRLSMPTMINDNTNFNEEDEQKHEEEQNEKHNLNLVETKETNSLYCNENLDNISDENKSIEDSMSSKISTDSSVLQFDNDTDQQQDKDKEQFDSKTHDNTILFPVDDDPFDFIKWSNGIGYLAKSNIHFQFNEYGLLEIMNLIDYNKLRFYDPNKNYERPLHERDNDQRHCKNLTTINNKETKIYFCQICLCNGIAADFLTPDYCSTVCQLKSKRIIKINSNRILNKNKESLLITSQQKNVLPSSSSSLTYRRSSTEAIVATTTTTTINNNNNNNNNVMRSPTHEDEQDEIDNNKIEIPVILNEKFEWDKYLKLKNNYVAPRKLFHVTNTTGNRFKIGMKLEAIDPENSSCFCVCTIVEQQTFRIKLHFDGYPSEYDFWTNADSPDLFPPNFCLNTKRTLRPPPKYLKNFNWDNYIADVQGIKAPRCCFSNTNFNTTNNFKTGMKLEADDLKNSGKVCVASVRDVIGNRILIHFDGWDDIYDYWTSITSPFIHPINWHKSSGFFLTLPPGTPGNFSWSAYLKATRTLAAPSYIFVPRDPYCFKVGMKLEVVDKKVPELIRPATVLATDEYEIKVGFDGWPEQYSFWLEDDSPDLFPVHWCSRTYHILEFPADYGPKYKNLCGITGCRGYGNAIKYNESYHYTLQECPYEMKNFIKLKKINNRLDIPIDILEKYADPCNNHNTKKRKINVNCEKIFKKIKRSSSDIEANDNDNDLIIDFEQNNIDIEQEMLPSSSSINNKELIKNKYINNNYNNPNKTIDLFKERLKVTKNLVNDYGPRLQQVYNLWKKNSRILTIKTNNINPLLWTNEQVYNYISKLPNCSDIAIKFKTENIDGRALLSLKQDDMLKNMNIKLGPAIKIYNQIVQLREDVTVNFLRL